VKKLGSGEIVVGDSDGARGIRVDWTFALRALARKAGGELEVTEEEFRETLNADDELLVEVVKGRRGGVHLALRQKL
jgi:hypothetical protein